MATFIFNNRHLNCCEKKILSALIDECGPSEVLMAIGQMVANEVPDLEIATQHRSEINRIAKSIKKLG